MRASQVYLYLALAVGLGIFFGASPLMQGLLRANNAAVAAVESPKGSSAGHLPHLPTPVVSSASQSAAPQKQGKISASASASASSGVTAPVPRLLFMTATYTLTQLAALQLTLDGMRDICNGGWDVSVHIDSASELTEEHPRFTEFKDRLWCARTRSQIPLTLTTYKKIGFGLNCKHRIVMRERLNDFDYFSFAEEDMRLSISHLAAFVSFESHLKERLPKTHTRYTIGFLRYEQSTIDTERVSWEYRPPLTHVATVPNAGEFIVTNNLNQAIFLLSHEQVEDLNARCAFLTDVGQNSFYRELRRAMDADWKYISAGVSEWSSSYQQVLQCGLRRVIPVDHYEQFMIHHATDKAQHRRPRSELLNARQLRNVITEKMQNPITIEEAYETHIFHQYNLNLIDPAKFHGKSSWSWGVPAEE